MVTKGTTALSCSSSPALELELEFELALPDKSASESLSPSVSRSIFGEMVARLFLRRLSPGLVGVLLRLRARNVSPSLPARFLRVLLRRLSGLPTRIGLALVPFLLLLFRLRVRARVVDGESSSS